MSKINKETKEYYIIKDTENGKYYNIYSTDRIHYARRYDSLDSAKKGILHVYTGHEINGDKRKSPKEICEIIKVKITIEETDENFVYNPTRRQWC